MGKESINITKQQSSHQKKDNKEVQFSFYLDKTLLKRIKQQALNKDESIKNIINSALENYLKNN